MFLLWIFTGLGVLVGLFRFVGSGRHPVAPRKTVGSGGRLSNAVVLRFYNYFYKWTTNHLITLFKSIIVLAEHRCSQVMVFEERGNPEYPDKNLFKQSREPTKSVHFADAGSGNRTRDIVEKWVPPLRQPCDPKNVICLFKHYMTPLLIAAMYDAIQHRCQL